MSIKKRPPTIIERIDAYLASGGLVNPELANHEAVRDLLIAARNQLNIDEAELKRVHALPDLEWIQARAKLMQHLASICRIAESESIRVIAAEMVKDLDKATLYFKRLRDGTRS